MLGNTNSVDDANGIDRVDSVELFNIETDVAVGDSTDLDALIYSVHSLQSSDGFEYPSLFLSGLHFMDSLRVLKSVKREGSYRILPVWVQDPENGEYLNIGEIQLDSVFLLAVRYIGCSVTLYSSEDEIISIDLSPESIAGYI